MASKIVSMPGASRVMAVGQVAGELVETTSPESRSHQALWRIRWWPGRAPVISEVWLARVTVGMPAMAPWRKDVPRAMRRATLGARPDPASR